MAVKSAYWVTVSEVVYLELHEKGNNEMLNASFDCHGIVTLLGNHCVTVNPHFRNRERLFVRSFCLFEVWHFYKTRVRFETGQGS